MPDEREFHRLIDAAGQAATAGDYSTAERLLQRAAEAQEAALGPWHPELANTLNNLGVASEIVQKPIEAERCFRRAVAIATAALAPGDSLLVTSRKNLEDFCAARGIDPFTPPEAPVLAAKPPSAAIMEQAAEAVPAALSGRRSPLVWWGAVALVAAGLAIAGTTLVNRRALKGTARQSAAPQPRSAAEPPPGPREDAPAPSVATSEPAALMPAEGRSGAASPLPATAAFTPPSIEHPRAAGGTEAPTVSLHVVAATLCRELSVGASDWNCVAPAGSIGAGRMFFYTRLTSPADAVVQHRWYRGDRLVQSVDLKVHANSSGGYRTYSRNSVTGPAKWRVELRAADGSLLHEERFDVE